MTDLLPLAVEAAGVGRQVHPRGDAPVLGYGTAGFRTTASVLDHVFYRVGILAALRSKALGGKAVGVMVTASHNPECDNGVKVVEPLGEMLVMEWEGHAATLANAADEDLAKVISDLVRQLNVDLSVKADVVIGRDTRTSSVPLTMSLCDGASVLRPVGVRSLGLTTTPQLHYVVRAVNTEGTPAAYGAPDLGGYADKLLTAFEGLVAGASPCQKYTGKLVVDCANGVGAMAMETMTGRLRSSGLETELRNSGDGPLNDGCGADFVKLKQAAPRAVDVAKDGRIVSYDGDADRVVYGFGEGGVFRLLDGDRIALLFAQFLAMLLKEAAIEGLRVGLVQTAYANGASTLCAVKALGKAQVICAKTGVKHCHHAALDMDAGMYYEANGHGTVLFSDTFVARVQEASSKAAPAAAAAAKKLLLFRDLINEAVGDAISNMLAVEAVLRLMDWSCAEWLAMYSDLPSRQIKVKVADRSSFETTDAERVCTKPEGMQAEIDKLVQAAPQGRAFVRPSGTEDVVRVYAEAENVDALLSLAQAVVDVVYEKGGGLGDKPKVA